MIFRTKEERKAALIARASADIYGRITQELNLIKPYLDPVTKTRTVIPPGSDPTSSRRAIDIIGDKRIQRCIWPTKGLFSRTICWSRQECANAAFDVHKGLDIAYRQDTPIYALQPGRVVHVRKGYHKGEGLSLPFGAFGNFIILAHNTIYGADGSQKAALDSSGKPVEWYSGYHHLTSYGVLVKVGDLITPDNIFKPIGYMGSTGLSTGNHLHLETHMLWPGHVKERNGFNAFSTFRIFESVKQGGSLRMTPYGYWQLRLPDGSWINP